VVSDSLSVDPMPETFDAVVLAEGPGAAAKVVGLTLHERARRVAAKAGAGRVLVIRDATERAAIARWWREGRATSVLVIRATDQVVHTPLVTPLVAHRDTAIATTPEGSDAGALFATGADATVVIDALVAGLDDRALAAKLTRAERIVHGDIARHPAVTPDERRAAAKMLYRIVHKPQDNALTRYLYRPLSAPMTKLFVRTPITPNQISILTAILIGIGLYFTARGPMTDAILGTAIVLFASYVDCCDGEVARLKLLSSKLGAWLDTIIDELSTVGYMVALGWHCHLWWGPDYVGELGFDPWLVAIAIGVITYAVTIYVVYYNIIVVVGSANSQDYVGRFEVVPGDAPNSVRLRPAAAQAIDTRELPPILAWLATYVPYIIRRDFLSWAMLGFAIVHVTHFAFAGLVAGGVVTAVIVTADHVRLVRQRRAIERAGQVLEVR
jgi:phosphatidylglycerophosphate synthase